MAVDDYYNQLIASKEVMEVVDALNLNISDHSNGYGKMDGKIIPNSGPSMIWPELNWTRRITSPKRFFLRNLGLYGTTLPIIMM